MILILSVIFVIVGLFFDFPYSAGLLFLGLLGLIYDMIKYESEYMKASNELFQEFDVGIRKLKKAFKEK